jgi:hypothetical protein
MMKVMVLYFVCYTHNVMTTLILFILVLVLLEQTQQLPSKFSMKFSLQSHRHVIFSRDEHSGLLWVNSLTVNDAATFTSHSNSEDALCQLLVLVSCSLSY